MTSGEYNCVKCGGGLVKGFAADRSQGSYLQARWVDGEPVNNTFFGIRGTDVVVDADLVLTIQGLRCSSCGYLELYAV